MYIFVSLLRYHAAPLPCNFAPTQKRGTLDENRCNDVLLCRHEPADLHKPLPSGVKRAFTAYRESIVPVREGMEERNG